MGTPIVVVAGARAGSTATSVCVNVAGLMARAGNRTLLLDATTSGDLGYDLGRPEVADGRWRYGALPIVEGPVPLLREVRPGLDLVVLEPVYRHTVGHLQADLDAQVSSVDLIRALAVDYDVVLIDGSGADQGLRAVAAHAAHWSLLVVRPDRVVVDSLAAALRDLPTPLGAVVAAAAPRPRTILNSTRRRVAEQLGPASSVFVSAVGSEQAVAWAARERGLLVHELASTIDPDVLDQATIDAVRGLARDYAEVAEELVIRLAEAEGVGS